jgi:O-antigen ligase
MKDSPVRNAFREPSAISRAFAFWLSLTLLVLVPLAFSRSAYRTFTLPKFLVLATGAAGLIPILLSIVSLRHQDLRQPRVRHVMLVSAYVAMIAIATIFGLLPSASLFGTFDNLMGLVTRISFYICFLAIIFGVGASWSRLMQALWGMSIAGIAVATLAFAQFFGKNLFFSATEEAFSHAEEGVARATGTLGHADYLGNFLLYTTLLCVGLAINSKGPARRFAAIGAVVSGAAIAFSGTRGAWLGLMVGAIVFLALDLPRRSADLKALSSRWIGARAAIACVVLLLSIALIASNPASRSMLARARLFMTEGFSGAGRTLLWRDSLPMVPDFAIAGCGPEAFRAAFLAYKSRDIARLAPTINNESSHNSYIDSAISFGLPGAVLYAAIIVSTFSLLVRARRRVAREHRVVVTALLSSFAAVTAHNFFIFDQIPTGLYFFAVLALACATSNVVEAPARSSLQSGADRLGKSGRREAGGEAIGPRQSRGQALGLAAGGVLLLVSASYSALSLNADSQLRNAFQAANRGDLDRTIGHLNDAARFFGPEPARDFTAARALTLCAERINASWDPNKTIAGARAIDLAIGRAQRAVGRTLEPDSSVLLVAYLAFLEGDQARLREYAGEAVKLDPHFANSRWLLAESYLAEGDRAAAIREAEIALDLNPGSDQARSALIRAGGEAAKPTRSVDELLERGRQSLSEGETGKAEKFLFRALERSGGRCPECHRRLATLYEQTGQVEDAIAEWKAFLREDPGRAAAEGASRHIEALEQKAAK